MNIDRGSLTDLLRLDDAQLSAVLRGVAVEAGLSADSIKLDAGEIARVRDVLRFATDEEIAALIEQIGGGRKNG